MIERDGYNGPITFCCDECGELVEARLEGGQGRSRNRASVHPAQDPGTLERREVAPDRLGGHAELLRESCDLERQVWALVPRSD